MVTRSLNRAFDFLEKLFELRDEVTLAIAKDTIIIDELALDKKNPVYRDFALHLHGMNIAYVTFLNGLTIDELYSFHRFLLEDIEGITLDGIRKRFDEYNLTHIRLGFIDYGAFSLKEAGEDEEGSKKRFWEWYVHGLLTGRLETNSQHEELHEIPPDILAGILNKVSTDEIREDAYDRVIADYLRSSSERLLSGKALKSLLEVIDGLRPELKRQFLASSVRELSKRDTHYIDKMLKETPVEGIIEFVKKIDEQGISMPDDLRNLINKFSRLAPNRIEGIEMGVDILADDILLPPDVTALLSGGRFEEYVNETYEKEIKKLLDTEAEVISPEMAKEMEGEWSEERIDKDFTHIVLDILSSDETWTLNEEDYKALTSLLPQQMKGFIDTGQYGEALKITETWQGKLGERIKDLQAGIDDPDILVSLTESLRIAGRKNWDDAMRLCTYYGEKIIPYLMHALINEKSQTIRSLFLNILIGLDERSAPEAIRHLKDERWYVKRNMLYILTEIGYRDAVSHIRAYCHDEHPRVSLQAIRYLLKIGDPYGIDVLRELITKGKDERFREALIMAGAFKVRDVVPDLLRMLEKRAIRGSDFDDKVLIVKTLGQIGDPSAIRPLKDILLSKSILFKGQLRRLKEEVHESLKNYPHDAVREIINDR
ncbi:MAG: HEAT repeat domain-containing protein [Thermodesulfovibrionia bacterium]